MTAEQIRSLSPRTNPDDFREKTNLFLQEIAAQLAEFNVQMAAFLQLKRDGLELKKQIAGFEPVEEEK